MATTALQSFLFLFNHPRWSVKCHAPMNKGGFCIRNKAFGSEWAKGIACRTRLCSTPLEIKPWQSLCVFFDCPKSNQYDQVVTINHDWCATKQLEWTMTGAQPSGQNKPWLVHNQAARMNQHSHQCTKWRMDGKWSWNRSLQTNHGSVP
jgi:hypothetical protein